MRSFIAICLALLMLLTAGCAKQAELVPESSVPGYFSQRQTLSGGSKMLRNVLLADVTAVREGEEVCLTLHFAQDGEPSRIPEYTVEPLMSPARLKVTLHAAAADVLALDLPPMGEFMGMVVETVEESAVVYLQFSGHVAYKLEENEESGTLTLRAWISGGRLCITLTDDGAGMSDEQYDKVNHAVLMDEYAVKHIGVGNVRSRLKLLCGENSSLILHPGETGGVCATMLLNINM